MRTDEERLQTFDDNALSRYFNLFLSLFVSSISLLASAP
ncbi:hypothetical protein VCR12J2_1010133 [Vibrio coralliirubri]|nr:hypothetical protein VCR12J2_1010133 [Vibrio coralliirubri]